MARLSVQSDVSERRSADPHLHLATMPASTQDAPVMVSSRPLFPFQLVSAEELAFYNAQLPPPMLQQHLESNEESGGVYKLSVQRSEPDGSLRSVSVPQTPIEVRPPPYLYHTQESRSDLQKYRIVFHEVSPDDLPALAEGVKKQGTRASVLVTPIRVSQDTRLPQGTPACMPTVAPARAPKVSPKVTPARAPKFALIPKPRVTITRAAALLRQIIPPQVTPALLPQVTPAIMPQVTASTTVRLLPLDPGAEGTRPWNLCFWSHAHMGTSIAGEGICDDFGLFDRTKLLAAEKHGGHVCVICEAHYEPSLQGIVEHILDAHGSLAEHGFDTTRPIPYSAALCSGDVAGRHAQRVAGFFGN